MKELHYAHLLNIVNFCTLTLKDVSTLRLMQNAKVPSELMVSAKS